MGPNEPLITYSPGCPPKYGRGIFFQLRGFATVPTGLKFDVSFGSRLKLHVRGRVSHSRIPSDHDLLQRSWRICTKFGGMQKEQRP